jgi:hypothetical protein
MTLKSRYSIFSFLNYQRNSDFSGFLFFSSLFLIGFNLGKLSLTSDPLLIRRVRLTIAIFGIPNPTVVHSFYWPIFKMRQSHIDLSLVVSHLHVGLNSFFVDSGLYSR